MDINIHRDFIEPIDLDELFALYETYNVNQLAVQIKLFYQLQKQIDIHIKTKNINQPFVSPKQMKHNYNKFYTFMQEHFPVIDVSEKIKERNKEIRTREGGKFRKMCHSNNLIMSNENILKKLTELIKTKSVFDKNAYQNEEIACECGCISYRKNLSRHKKSKLHEKRLEEVNKLFQEEEDK